MCPSKFFKNEKISLDFDGVLSTNKGQDLASSLKDKGAILYIVTARNSSAKNLDLFKVAELLQIPTNRIIFTNGKDKWKTLKDLEIDTHYDNNQEQIDKIRSNTSVKGILFNGYTLTQTLKKIIKEKGLYNTGALYNSISVFEPIIYTGGYFWNSFISPYYDGVHTLWVADYRNKQPNTPLNMEWVIWQFTCKAKIPGIKTKVDKNICVNLNEILID